MWEFSCRHYNWHQNSVLKATTQMMWQCECDNVNSRCQL